MPASKNIVDIYFTPEGDFFLSDNEDLEDTTRYAYRGLIQKITTRMESSKGDWPLQQGVGADLNRFVGQPNTQVTGSNIVRAIQNELVGSGVLLASELLVEVVPLTQDIVGIILFITPAGSSRSIVLNFTYDLRDNKIVPR